jgi:hypothetical protein
MADRVLLNDGTSRVLLNDGTSFVLLNALTFVVSAETLALRVLDIWADILESHAGEAIAIDLSDDRKSLLVSIESDNAAIGFVDSLRTLLKNGTPATLVSSSDTIAIGLPSEDPFDLGEDVQGEEIILSVSDDRNTMRITVEGDTAAITISETSSRVIVQNITQVASADTTRLGLSDASNLIILLAVQSTDTVALGLSEATRPMTLCWILADTLAITASEVLVGQVVLSPKDQAALGLTETIRAFVAVQATDITPIGIIELQGAMLMLVTTADVLAVGLSELSTTQAASLSTDTASLGLLEASGLLVPLSRAEAMAIGLTDAVSQQFVAFVGSDVTAIVALENVALLLAFLASSDALGITVTNEIGTVNLGAMLTPKQSTESVAIGLSDASTLFVAFAVSAADTLGVGLAEASSIAASLLVAEAMGITLDDATSRILAIFAVSDAAAVRVSELTAAATALLSNDAVAVAMLETDAAMVLLQVADALGVGLLEAFVFATAVRASDALRLRLSERVIQVIAQGPVDFLPRILTRPAVLTGGDDRYVSLGKGAS